MAPHEQISRSMEASQLPVIVISDPLLVRRSTENFENRSSLACLIGNVLKSPSVALCEAKHGTPHESLTRSGVSRLNDLDTDPMYPEHCQRGLHKSYHVHNLPGRLHRCVCIISDMSPTIWSDKAKGSLHRWFSFSHRLDHSESWITPRIDWETQFPGNKLTNHHH